MKRVAGLLVGVVLAAGVISFGVAPPAARADSWSDAMSFVGPINALRAQHGLSPLAVDTRLTNLAGYWSAKMAAAGKLSHNPDLAAMLPAGFTVGGENVGFGGNSAGLEAAFEASPAHLANLLRPDFSAIGVAVVWSGPTMWVTEDFTAGLAPIVLARPATQVAAMAAMRRPDGKQGYWVATRTGGVSSFGAAPNLGSLAGLSLNAPIIGMSATPDGNGYLLLGADGGIFSFGDAAFYGSTGAMRLNAPVVAMAGTPSGRGYWLVASDGGIFTFGDAGFYGSTGAIRLNAPVVGMTASSTGRGYRLVASDGGIFTFGDAAFYGSTGAVRLNRPVIGMSTDPTTGGYRLVASDGGVFTFNAAFYGSLGGTALAAPISSMAATTDGHGYYLAGGTGTIYCYGDASFFGNAG